MYTPKPEFIICGHRNIESMFRVYLTIEANLISFKQRTRKINNETLVQFQLILENETLESVFKGKDTNQSSNSFLHTFLHIFEAGFPIQYKSIIKIRND
jgi:hypothetical protein